MAPSDSAIGMSGGVNPCEPGEPPLLSSPPPESVPQAATPSSSTALARPTRPVLHPTEPLAALALPRGPRKSVVRLFMIPPPQVVVRPGREQTRAGPPGGRVATTARHVV